ncbi:MAG: bifunctional phosphoribosylaminoimidazolecarboxamide formyltransferase/IMP cyclohydrolase [Candidatus Promineifilaceae bacterium]|nr:bifunctional phosphoribosylaminoimidazolecarboxamide formyltransferase/IMP cyclohydrolase [Candidatus Promineifilaceae bacterium]
MSKRAILSVYDKRNLTDLAQGLTELGWELLASGGTAQALREDGLAVREVAEVTGAPELLGGRVKTLHPAIHGGILARANAADEADLNIHNIAPIDLVVCNLYPFRETVARPEATMAEVIEQIDIGGVALLRAGAKNFARVTVLCEPDDYQLVLDELQTQGAVTAGLRQRLAYKAFALTRDYDAAIAAFLEEQAGVEEAARDELPQRLTLPLKRIQTLRYGENPHQAAALYSVGSETGPLGGQLLQGKALSYNNLLDLDAAWQAAGSFTDPTVVIVKHLSPCGIASAHSPAAAFGPALASDPVSAFGSVIAVNRPINMAFTEVLGDAELFVEAVVAPTFTAAAQRWFAANKSSCRLVAVPSKPISALTFRSVRGGLLAQTVDAGDPADTAWQVVGQRVPSEQEWQALRFGWQAVQQVKSNAIVLARGQATVGIGGGLPSRVDAVRLAASKAGERARGAVLASDAFFPFPDGIEAAAAAGVSAVVEPGGSVRDEQVIAAADRLGLALVFTGVRHFRH